METRGTIAGLDPDQVHEQQLLKQMAGQDEFALSEFYDHYHRLVYSFVLRVVGNATEAEDVVVDVFWQVWRQAGQYDPARGKVFTWLMTMARTRALDRLRGLQRHDTLAQAMAVRQQDSVTPIVDPDEDLYLAERRKRVRAALDALPDNQRQAIELAYYGGLSQSEIAAATGEPLGTIKTRMRTGLAQLRRTLHVDLV